MTTEAIQTADLEAKKLRDQGEDSVWLDELTPRQIVAELDKYIIGQSDAKKAVAIVLRNRWRRQRVEEEMRDEIEKETRMYINKTVATN